MPDNFTCQKESADLLIFRFYQVENILRNSKGDFVLCDYGSASTTPVDPKVMLNH
jgi:hypothetical protein